MSSSSAVIPVDSPLSSDFPRSGVLLLLQLRTRCLRNTLKQTLAREPLKILASGVSIFIIWVGLYIVLRVTLEQIRSQVLEAIVAVPLIFTFFFLALMGMLMFSNAILAYGALFRRQESLFLMATPLSFRDVVLVKYLESLFLSSWSLLLIGFPLMLALAHSFDEDWTFYPLFIATFLMFIPMPGALGMLLAWGIALIAPKSPRRSMTMLGAVVVLAGGWWVWGLLDAPVGDSRWLTHLFETIAPLQHGLWPHEWVAKGLDHALQGRTSDSLFYLYVTFANGLFISYVSVHLVAWGFSYAFARAQVSSARSDRTRGAGIERLAERLARYYPSAARERAQARIARTLHVLRYEKVEFLAEILFAYLPPRLRLLAKKDLRTFFRDPLQWSQMVILLGLMVMYIVYAQNQLMESTSEPRLQLLVSFLNLTAVSLILATFTSRFVFPLVSLEGQQAWMLGLLPLPRSRVVMAKFLYALSITLVAALGVTLVSVYRLSLPMPLIISHLVAMTSICIGLCGVSIGMGARMPVFTERNPARIAGGFGGTLSLLISVGLVIFALTGMAMMTWEALRTNYGTTMTSTMIAWTAGVALLNVVATTVTLTMGIRHFQRLQF